NNIHTGQTCSDTSENAQDLASLALASRQQISCQFCGTPLQCNRPIGGLGDAEPGQLFGFLGWHTVKLALRISRIEAAFEMVSTFQVELRRFAVSLYRLLNRDIRGQAMIETAVALPVVMWLAFNTVNFGYFFLMAVNL